MQQSISKAQKIKGLLNVFGVYDYTNDQMLTHSYKHKTSRHFLDFIKRVDRKYNDNTKHIFLIMDNASIHKSKIIKETLSRYYPRIHLVFLPTRTPELDLIKIRWLWLHEQTGDKQFHI
jgi:transposase